MSAEINPLPGYSPIEGGGKQRTEVHCHECNKTFIAELDFDVNGDHSIICPICSHEHCRTIKDGKITGDRWSTRPDKKISVDKRSIWKSNIVYKQDNQIVSGAKTSTVAMFIRDAWLNGKDLNIEC